MSSEIECASSPCLWDETGELHEPDPRSCPEPPADVAGWRRAEREKQLAARTAIPLDRREDMAVRIAACLEKTLGKLNGRSVSLYWPIRGEPDLRPLVPRIMAMNGVCALPVVVERGRPLEFRTWAPGEPLQRGIWNIPVPAAGEAIEPDLLLAPVVAFDRACYRLGYGGGYFDRTLAELRGRPRVIGVGYASARIATIHPQAHDVAMDAVVTEKGLLERG